MKNQNKKMIKANEYWQSLSEAEKKRKDYKKFIAEYLGKDGGCHGKHGRCKCGDSKQKK